MFTIWHLVTIEHIWTSTWTYKPSIEYHDFSFGNIHNHVPLWAKFSRPRINFEVLSGSLT